MPKNQIETIKYVSFLLVFSALIVMLVVLYKNSTESRIPIIFSERDMLNSLWREYKEEYLEPGTSRTIDKQRNGVTTSEGQSYTLLRAVWVNDKETFDASLDWTENNLQHEDDALFSWLFGRREDGTYGVVTQVGGNNSASDASTDIALSLVFAYARWGEEEYLNKAREIVRDIWEIEVVTIDGAPVLTANDLEKTSGADYVVVNPSYFAPYAYKIFAKLDTEHPWLDLVDNSYAILEETLESPLDTKTSAGLPPDWIFIDRDTGELLSPPIESGLTTNYSYDALRIPWRLSLDYQWFNEPRARALLEKMNFLTEEWKINNQLFDRYAHNGEPLGTEEPFAMYGGSIGQLMMSDPKSAQKMYRLKLITNYNPDSGMWKKDLSYYDTNWAWFGIALYSDLLPNLSRSIPDGTLSGEDPTAVVNN